MIGLDFPVKPEWIHDVHVLWQPEQPVGDLVQAALKRTMQELGGEKTRRNSLSIILRYFVAFEGERQSRRTLSQDVWATYSRTYPVSMMAPAYLAHLIAQSEVAQAACEYITQRYSPGDILSSTDLRQHVIRRFGERKVVTNAASAFLRSLTGFGVLTAGKRRGQFLWAGRLSVLRSVTLACVWPYRSPIHDQAEVIQEQTQLATDDPARVGPAFSSDLLSASAFLWRMSQLNGIVVSITPINDGPAMKQPIHFRCELNSRNRRVRQGSSGNRCR